ncbi:MAG: YceI family protein [Bacteroidetes bacterium]|nr:YceI family protein [Bacteroidota bacterium]
MKHFFIAFTLTVSTFSLFAQTKTTTSAIVAFDATTALDALPKAENKTAVGMIDTKTGQVGFEAAVNNFAFSNPTIQEHFNEERWLNSAKFPLFTFQGKITNLNKVNFAKDGTYTVSVEGTMTIKDKTNPLSTTATLVVNKGAIRTTAGFSIKLSDYGVDVGTRGKISNEPKITVSADFK